MTKPASASGWLAATPGSRTGSLSARLVQQELAEFVGHVFHILHLLEHGLPGTSRTPPVITSLSSPQHVRRRH